MALEVQEVAISLIGVLKPLVDTIGAHDRSLADQLRRASSSIVLAIGEGAYSRKGNQTARYNEALASAAEARNALRLAVAWGYVDEPRASPSLELLDRVVAMTWRLIHRRRS